MSPIKPYTDAPKITRYGGQRGNYNEQDNQPLSRYIHAKAFRAHRSLSAVVLVSIFARPDISKPLQKRPRPWLYANPSARVPLANKGIDVINRLDFERWP